MKFLLKVFGNPQDHARLCRTRSWGYRGFTLIETVVTISIFTIVMTAMMFAIQYFYRTNAYVFEQTMAVENARTGVIDAMRDLREATYGVDGAYPIFSADSTDITFYADIKGDGVIDKVHYYLSGTTLYRGVIVPAGDPLSYSGQPEIIYTIATYVRTTTVPIFRYYDSKGNQLTAPVDIADVASVNTTITVNLNPLRAPDNFTLSAGATLRNLLVQ